MMLQILAIPRALQLALRPGKDLSSEDRMTSMKDRWRVTGHGKDQLRFKVHRLGTSSTQ
jgi:hypothetical protein